MVVQSTLQRPEMGRAAAERGLWEHPVLAAALKSATWTKPGRQDFMIRPFHSTGLLNNFVLVVSKGSKNQSWFHEKNKVLWSPCTPPYLHIHQPGLSPHHCPGALQSSWPAHCHLPQQLFLALSPPLTSVHTALFLTPSLYAESPLYILHLECSPSFMFMYS